jgi:hypothetical protein
MIWHYRTQVDRVHPLLLACPDASVGPYASFCDRCLTDCEVFAMLRLLDVLFNIGSEVVLPRFPRSASLLMKLLCLFCRGVVEFFERFTRHSGRVIDISNYRYGLLFYIGPSID